MKLSLYPVLLLRLAVGALFLSLAIDKYNEGWLTNSEPLRSSLTGYQEHAAGPQKTYLETVAIPYAGIWSKFIVVGEGCLGISLLLGFLVRLSTATGILMVLSFHAANGNLFAWKFFSTPWAGLALTALLLLLLARSGRWAGIDAYLSTSNPKGICW